MKNAKNISNVRILEVLKSITIGAAYKASVISFFDESDASIGIMLILTVGCGERTLVLDYSDTCATHTVGANIFLDVSYKHVYAFAEIGPDGNIELHSIIREVA